MIEPLHLEIIDDHYSLTLFYFFPCIFQCFCKKQVVFWSQENLNVAQYFPNPVSSYLCSADNTLLPGC